jgi:RimJ/RimL family protein N-acetyltransferase
MRWPFRRRVPFAPHANSRDPVLTERLLIRMLVRPDAAAVMASIDDVVERTNGWLPHTKHELIAAIESGGAFGHRAICERSSGQLIGVVQSYDLTRSAADRCQIGFWIGPSHRSQGYATEAVAAFVDHLHGLGMRVVDASTASTNEPVIRILTRVGFGPGQPGQRTLPNGDVLDALDFEHHRPAND